MKLKYYLKGLGTGILFTSIILSISFAVYDRQNDKKTEDEIIAAALEAGMVWPEESSSDEDTTPDENTPEGTTPEETTTTPIESTPEATTPEATTPEATTPEETTTTPIETTPEKTTTVPEQTTSEQTTPEESTTKEPETTLKKDLDACILYKDASKVKIQILKGMNSYDVAKILEKAGILKGFADREAFNDYLVASGYSGLILVGIFEIPVGATYNEIISIVCRQ
ncbi:MAG: endolytic transglycosylase MltG [Lachnospiraceae bacterium]|nr:endolytic transglycosylase MltG [Lachnospiraceae bacterium]